MSDLRTNRGVNERVERRVVVHESSRSVNVRLNGDPVDAEGVWLQPENGVDGDGEFFLSFEGLAGALHVLGYAHEWKPEVADPDDSDLADVAAQ